MEETMSKINFTAVKEFMAVDSEGHIDYVASQKKYLDALKSFELVVETDHKVIAEAFASTFAEHKGVSITNVCNYVMRKIDSTPDTHNDLLVKCHEYLKLNSGEVGEATFGIKKGKGGGCARWADLADTDPRVIASKKAIEEREAAKVAAAKVAAAK